MSQYSISFKATVAVILLLLVSSTGWCFSNFTRTDHWKNEYVDVSLTMGSGGNADNIQKDLYPNGNPVPLTTRVAITWTNGRHMITTAGTTLMHTYSSTDPVTGDKISNVRSDFWDVGVLYGQRLLSGSHGLLSASAGFAVTHLRYKNNLKLPAGTTDVGVPVDVHALWTISRGFGLGFDAFANLNTKNIFYGGGLSFNVGF